jgi:hypothetical protein
LLSLFVRVKNEIPSKAREPLHRYRKNWTVKTKKQLP